MKRTTQKVPVTLKMTAPQVVEGIVTVNPYLAITPVWEWDHPSEDTYNVTHIPTGQSVACYWGIRKARKIAGALSGLLDWSQCEDGIGAQFSRLPKEVQQWARSLRYA